jgi:hypothetical protein
MKYIFIIKGVKNCEALKNNINKESDLVIKIDLWDKNDTMYCIYDDTNNQISFYNKLSVEKVFSYPAFCFGASSLSSLDFFLLVGYIRNFFGLTTNISSSESYGNIVDISILNSEEKKQFNETLKGFNISSPLNISSASNLGHGMYSFLMNGFLCEDINFSKVIFNYSLSSKSKSTIYDFKVTSLSNVPAKIVDFDSFFGCHIKDFMIAMKEHDIKDHIKESLIHRTYMKSNGKLILDINKYQKELIIIKHKKDTIALQYEDFLLAVDSSAKLMNNMLKEISISHGYGCSLLFSSDKMLFDVNKKIIYTPNIFELLPYRYDLLNGRSY